MYHWAADEKLYKFMLAVDKATKFEVEAHNIQPGIIRLAYEQTKKAAAELTLKLLISDQGDLNFITSWIEVGFFGGFIAGMRSFERNKNSVDIQKTAELFSQDQTNIIFERLTNPPVSPLVSAIHPDDLQSLRCYYENSSYSGFLAGIEQASLLRR